MDSMDINLKTSAPNYFPYICGLSSNWFALFAVALKAHTLCRSPFDEIINCGSYLDAYIFKFMSTENMHTIKLFFIQIHSSRSPWKWVIVFRAFNACWCVCMHDTRCKNMHACIACVHVLWVWVLSSYIIDLNVGHSSDQGLCPILHGES